MSAQPALLPALYQGFHYHRRGEEAPGDDPVTPHKVPVYARSQDGVSCRYIRSRIRAAANALGREPTADFKRAQSAFEDTAERRDQMFVHRAARGEVVFHNNYTVLHGREAFVDPPSSPTRRHFLRLWLEPSRGKRPIPPEMEIFPGGVIVPQDGRKPVFDDPAFAGTIYQPK